jgi:hypothetical protein
VQSHDKSESIVTSASTSSVGELDFGYGHDTIGPVDSHVDLRIRVLPRRHVRLDSRNAQGPLDRWRVLQAQAFEGKTSPRLPAR